MKNKSYTSCNKLNKIVYCDGDCDNCKIITVPKNDDCYVVGKKLGLI